MKKFLLICLFVCLPLQSWGTTINVPADYSDIQLAIDAANTGDTILLADATYSPTSDFGFDCSGKSLTIKSANGKEHCIVDCQQNGRAFAADNGAALTLEGLTIRNGRLDSQSGGAVDIKDSKFIARNCNFENCLGKYGGALSLLSSPFTLSHCLFSHNTSLHEGGAVWVKCSASTFTATMQIEQCVFENNHASKGGGLSIFGNDKTDFIFTNTSFRENIGTSAGGAVYTGKARACRFDNCYFGTNQGYEGGALINKYTKNIILNQCTFFTNRSSYKGGACYFFDYNVSLQISNCYFEKNDATICGGAIVARTPGKITGCRFSQNKANQYGGALFFGITNLAIVNSLFHANQVNDFRSTGGAIHVSLVSSNLPKSHELSLTNCTLSNNSAVSEGGALWSDIALSAVDENITMTNCIVWNNRAKRGPGLFEKTKPMQINYSDLQQFHVGNDNISAAPQFVDANYNFHLRCDSPCIDSGTSEAAPADDLDGILRPVGAGYDMGVYEYPHIYLVWEGTNEHWQEGLNWDDQRVPLLGDCVFIVEANTHIDPIITTADARAGALMINSGKLTIAAGELILAN